MYHQPVMFSECMQGLDIQSDGIYVDATFGGGGHSLGILEKLKGGRLIAFDHDQDAIKEAKKINHSSFTFCEANFRHLKHFLKLLKVTAVNGIFADLGISSHQIDVAERGFSTRQNGLLDMRMNKGSKLTASKILNEYSEQDLHRIFGSYGEIRNAKTLAKLIVEKREDTHLDSTIELTKVIETLAPRGKNNRYFSQVFQALRIEVNEELDSLSDFLLQCHHVMVKGGRLAILSYHSLEDRLVKNYINTGNVEGKLEKDFYGHVIKPFQAVNKKPITPSLKEVKENNRSRSAKLRIAIRIGE